LEWLLQPRLEKQLLPTAAVFPRLLTSDSSKVTKPGPKISQLRQQNSVLPALLRSLVPALTPLLLVLPLLICGSHVVLYKVCGVSTYLSVFVQPWKRQSQDGKDIGEKQAKKKGLCLQNNLILQGCKHQKNEV